jgi:hypothetical protein
MLLAARALGLGAALTTLYLNFEKEVEAALGLPADMHSYALLPIGSMGRFGPVRRVPLAEVVYEDEWGRPYPLPSPTGRGVGVTRRVRLKIGHEGFSLSFERAGPQEERTAEMTPLRFRWRNLIFGQIAPLLHDKDDFIRHRTDDTATAIFIRMRSPKFVYFPRNAFSLKQTYLTAYKIKPARQKTVHSK